MPKKPIMTDGMDAMSSIIGLTISRRVAGANSERYIAIAMLNGTAKAAAKNVTVNDATINGNVPNFGGTDVGYQLVPNKNSFTLTLLNTGNPSLKRNIIIKNKKATETNPTTAKIYRIILSLAVWMFKAIFNLSLSMIL